MDKNIQQAAISFTGRLEQDCFDTIYVSKLDEPDQVYDLEIDLEKGIPKDIHKGDIVRIDCIDYSVDGVSLWTTVVNIKKIAPKNGELDNSYVEIHLK